MMLYHSIRTKGYMIYVQFYSSRKMTTVVLKDRKEKEPMKSFFIDVIVRLLNLFNRFDQLKSIYDEQLMDQLHRILVSRSTFVEMLIMKPRLNHQSILSIYVQVVQ